MSGTNADDIAAKLLSLSLIHPIASITPALPDQPDSALISTPGDTDHSRALVAPSDIPGAGTAKTAAAGVAVAVAVAGMGVALQAMRELIGWPVLYREEGRQLGVCWPRGLLLHGPPGCGKTLLVRTVAGAVDQ